MEEFQKTAHRLGFEIDITSSGALQQSLLALDAQDPDKGQLLRIMAVRPMQRAVYVCSGLVEHTRHYALAMDRYTHFTSPIRRYADFVVHRLLHAALVLDSDPAADVSHLIPGYTGDWVADQARQCNDRKAAARDAQDASSHLYLCMYLQHRARGAPANADGSPGVLVDTARILRVRDRSIDVVIPQLGVEGLLYYDKMPLDSFRHDEGTKTTSVTWRASGKTDVLDTFGEIKVSVVASLEKCPPTITLAAVDPYAGDFVDAMATEVDGDVDVVAVAAVERDGAVEVCNTYEGAND